MANTRSAAKQARVSERRRAHNRAIKSRLHTLERKFLDAIAAQKSNDAQEALRAVYSALDKAAKTRVIHPNHAARKKSRLMARLKKLLSAPAAVPAEAKP
ncbi:MAG: 30S ribosomal protein S20 [Verrucomicrobiae bacterium]|nr:30S ribosomal protein S20 [Verrucomicrobiae bacterium]